MYLKVKTWKLWLFSFFNLPLIFWLRPRIIEINNNKASIMIKLNHRSRNHIKSMYFGALCSGVDLAPGVLAMHLISQQKHKISFVFKDFQAKFLHRCEDNTYFTCNEGHLISVAINKTITTGKRQNITLNVFATVPSKFDSEPTGKFQLTLSLKKY
ncbi:DUF4442 domain-containing protein [Gammaproteobacteria bacterium]|nr:DUF4442 domain-containing protein [Gammaproteobacteria bacterium]